MDDLDRLFRTLILNIRSAFPDLENRSIEVAQIYQQIVPYRTTRNALGLASNEDYEHALLQLLSGARGYLSGDPEMQASLRSELESANPDLTAYRAFATSVVQVSALAARQIQSTGASPEAAMAVAASRATEAMEPAAELAVDPRPSALRTADVQRQLAGIPANTSTGPVAAMPPSPIRVSAGTACRYCACALPEGRSVVFCPGCGHNLTVQHCPACNTELEVGWKFCITCGRDTR